MKVAAGIEYRQVGVQSPGCATVICLHGIGGDDNSFTPQLKALSLTHRVIAWNMPGYGNSLPLSMTSFNMLVNALENFMDALDIDAGHLLGQSIGGMLAMEFALTHPRRSNSLTLIATTAAFGGRDSSFKDAFLAARLAPLDKGLGMADLAEAFVPEITGSLISAAALEAAITSMAAVPLKTYRNILQCLVTFNRRNDIRQLQCPVCLIAGSEDNNAPARTMRKMADVIPQAEFHNILGAGHLVNLEVPEKTSQIIQQFLHRIAQNTRGTHA